MEKLGLVVKGTLVVADNGIVFPPRPPLSPLLCSPAPHLHPLPSCLSLSRISMRVRVRVRVRVCVWDHALTSRQATNSCRVCVCMDHALQHVKFSSMSKPYN